MSLRLPLAGLRAAARRRPCGALRPPPCALLPVGAADHRPPFLSLPARSWNAALQTGDPEKVADMYADESVLLPTVSNQVRPPPPARRRTPHPHAALRCGGAAARARSALHACPATSVLCRGARGCSVALQAPPGCAAAPADASPPSPSLPRRSLQVRPDRATKVDYFTMFLKAGLSSFFICIGWLAGCGQPWRPPLHRQHRRRPGALPLRAPLPCCNPGALPGPS